MKPLCSDDFVKNYFHNNDVFGNECAELNKIISVAEDEKNGGYIAVVDIDAVPCESSALYDKDNKTVSTSFDLHLSQNEKGTYIIDGISTDGQNF